MGHKKGPQAIGSPAHRSYNFWAQNELNFTPFLHSYTPILGTIYPKFMQTGMGMGMRNKNAKKSI